MVDSQFFRDLGSRFTALQQSHDPREELHALYSETSQEHRAKEFGVMARQWIMAGDAEAAYRHIRVAAHAGHAVLNGVTTWSEYFISGGPSDHTVRQSLKDQWSALATLGATAACGSAGSASSEQACTAWLDLLRTRSAHYRELNGSATIDGEHFATSGGVVERLCRASAELCLGLESEMALKRPEGLSSEQPIAGQTMTAPKFTPSEPLVAVQKAAKLLGVHEDTVRRMQDAGTIHLVRVGHLRRVRKSDIDRLLRTEDYPKRRV
jgi:excisionase family DNA binding protein